MGSRTDCCHLFSVPLLFCPNSSLPASGSLNPSIQVPVYLLPTVWRTHPFSQSTPSQYIYISREKFTRTDPLFNLWGKRYRFLTIIPIVREREEGKRIEKRSESWLSTKRGIWRIRGEDTDRETMRGLEPRQGPSSRSFRPAIRSLHQGEGGFSHGNGGRTTLGPGLIERNAVTIVSHCSLRFSGIDGRPIILPSPWLLSLLIQPPITESLSPTCYPVSR